MSLGNNTTSATSSCSNIYDINYDINKTYNNRQRLVLTDNIIKENLVLLKENLEFFNKENKRQNKKEYETQDLKGISTILNKMFNNIENGVKNSYDLPYKNRIDFAYGRIYSKNSLMSLGSYFRDLLIDDKTTQDLDICNCHPAILLQIIDDLETPCLKYYINNRDKCLLELQDKFKIERKEAKTQVLTLINNGSINKKFHSINWISGIIKEMKLIYDHMSKKEIGIKAIKHLYSQCHIVKGHYYKSDNTPLNINGSFLNLILIKAEYDIINKVIDYLELNKINIYTYCFDGLMISNNYKNENILNDISQYVFKELGLKVEFDFKKVENKLTDELKNKLKKFIKRYEENKQHIKTLNKLNDKCKNSLNVLSQQAGMGKTSHVLDYILNDKVNVNNNIDLIISPYIINQQSNIEKLIDLNMLNNGINMSKFNIHFVNSIDKDEVFDEKRINILIQGDNNPTIEKLVKTYEYDYYRNLKFEDDKNGTRTAEKFIFESTDYFNINKTIILTTYDSFKWVVSYLKKFNKTVNNYFLDESIQILTRSVKPIEADICDNVINRIDTQSALIKLIDLSTTVFISDIVNLNSVYNLTQRKINKIVFDKEVKHISYDNIYLGNDLNIFYDLLKEDIPMFIWSVSKKQCKEIKNTLIKKFKINPSDIILITADLVYDVSFLKYKYIISSPKIRSCISIGIDSDDKFNNRITCGFYQHNFINEYDFINSIQRVRKAKSLFIFTNKLKENHVIYDYNKYDSDVEIKIMSILNESNNLTMKNMINTLIKTDDYKYYEDFEEDRNINFEKCYILKDKVRKLNESHEVIKNRIIFNGVNIIDDNILKDNEVNDVDKNDVINDDAILNELNDVDKNDAIFDELNNDDIYDELHDVDIYDDMINKNGINDNIKKKLISINTEDKVLSQVIDMYNNATINKMKQTEYIVNLRSDYNSNISNDKIIKEELEEEYDYLTNHNKVRINMSDVFDLSLVQVNDEYNKVMNKVKTILDKNNIYYKDYVLEDTSNFGILTKQNELVKSNIKQYYKTKQIIKNIETHYKKLDEINKFQFLLNSKNKKIKKHAKYNHPYLQMYKISKDDIDLTNKLITSFEIERTDKQKFNFSYFDIDDYANNLDNADTFKKTILNRKDKIDINRNITKELLERNVNVDCMNYRLVKNEIRQLVLKKVNIDEYKFCIYDFKFIY